MRSEWIPLFLVLLLTGCARDSGTSSAGVDPAISKALDEVKAIDNHAHPVRPVAAGEAPDSGYDALPVENLEPSSDIVRFRPGRPEYAAANKAIFDGDRAAAAKSWGANYAANVLDKSGIGMMVANRVSMGEGLPKDRFLWAAYADALMYPWPTGVLEINSDRKAYFALEAKLLTEYYKQSGAAGRPATLDEYVNKVLLATIQRHKQGGAIAEKFEMAYLRYLGIGNPSKADAERAWRTAVTNAQDYRVLQDYLFRQIALECGRLGTAVHIHTGFGAGGYYENAGARPVVLEPLYNDPELRKTNIVMVHGGWPYAQDAAPLLVKPNAYVDISVQGLILPPSMIARGLRPLLETNPEKVLFGTDAYPYAPSNNMGWEETAYVSARAARTGLYIALSDMLREGTVTQDRAIEIGKLVLRDNAAKLYGIKP